MNQSALFEEAVATMNALRQAAKEGDEEARLLVEMAEKCNPAFVGVDLAKWRKHGTSASKA